MKCSEIAFRHKCLPLIAVVIPAYKVKKQVLSVIQRIDKCVSKIYVIDDCCPEQSGEYVKENCSDNRVSVITHTENQGVGGAVMTGYSAALADNMDIVVKIDGDGQMDPGLLFDFIGPILSGDADYTKGNRFFNLEDLSQMPKIRLFGNAVLSFMNKLSSGYWHLFDPTNGYTAIHSEVLRHLSLEKISKRYFFESDMLFRLNTIRAVVCDVTMESKYGDEVSNLSIRHIWWEFLRKNVRNTASRIFYNYYLRDVSVASFELPLGLGLLLFGVPFGLSKWFDSYAEHSVASAGTVMLASLPVILGVQFLLAFLNYDIRSTPVKTFHLTKLKNKHIVELMGANDEK